MAVTAGMNATPVSEMALALMLGRTWTPYPALGWGLGLLLHGAVVWLALPGAHWREALVARERAALARERSGHNDSTPQ